MANETYIVDHLSFSSIRSFLTDRYKFLLETMRVWQFKASPSMLVGQAGHKALEVYYRDHLTPDEAIAVGLAHIERTRDIDIDWGKTGTREDVVKRYTFAINAFFSEEPKMIGEQVAVEEKITEFLETDERFGAPARFDLPLCAVPDRIVRTSEGLIIRDHKFVHAYSDAEGNSPERIFQALCYYHPVKSKYAKPGERVVRAIFDEIKTSKNKDGSPQRQEWTVEFDDCQEWFVVFYKLYGEILEELAKPNVKFLPNIFDRMTGEESLTAYMSEIVGIERPKLVKHKTGDFEIEMPERKYVASKTDSVENAALTPEEKVRVKLQEFGIAVQMGETETGFAITRYTLKPARGIRMSEFRKHEADIAIALRAKSVRIEAPIPGTGLVGIEVPNEARTYPVLTAEHVESLKRPLSIPIGVNVRGDMVQDDLAEMPHLLVAGRTGAGKSVFLNGMIRALTERNSAQEMKLILIDPKRVELAPFAKLPHVMVPVVHDAKKATKTLEALAKEMDRRYDVLDQAAVRDIDTYNAQTAETMPRVVVVIDEFADLILQAKEMQKSRKRRSKKTVLRCRRSTITLNEADGEELTAQDFIIRLAQKARAVGIHLVLATQRPSVDVVTGLLKANLPTRIAFACSSSIDSKVILDTSGAECLMGNGDLLFMSARRGTLDRLQGLNIE